MKESEMFRANRILEANKKKFEKCEKRVAKMSDIELSTLDEIIHNEIIKRHIKKIKYKGVELNVKEVK